MQLFIYKLYYVSFLNFSKYKQETPWVRAQMVLTGCLGSLAVGAFGTFHLLSPLKNLFHIPNTSENFDKYIFVFILLLSIWKGLSYFLYKKLQISKVDGKSPLFEFNLTKKNKIFTWFYIITLLLSSIIIKGIEMFFLAL